MLILVLCSKNYAYTLIFVTFIGIYSKNYACIAGFLLIFMFDAKAEANHRKEKKKRNQQTSKGKKKLSAYFINGVMLKLF